MTVLKGLYTKDGSVSELFSADILDSLVWF